MEIREVIVAVIPAFNESQNIRDVVTRSLKYVDYVLVVDDGSNDGTGEIASSAGAELLKQVNQGVGAATRNGIAQALLDHPDAGALVLLDGDGQHNPDDIGPMLQDTMAGSDLVIGKRSIRLDSAPLTRWVGNWAFAVLRNVGSAYAIEDAECGFRVFSRKALNTIGIDTEHFGFCEEIAIKARACGLIVSEVPVETIYRNRGRHPKYTIWRKLYQGSKIAISIIKWRWLFEWKPAFGMRQRSKPFGSAIERHSPGT